jgi:hypothetical protein
MTCTWDLSGSPPSEVILDIRTLSQDGGNSIQAPRIEIGGVAIGLPQGPFSGFCSTATFAGTCIVLPQSKQPLEAPGGKPRLRIQFDTTGTTAASSHDGTQWTTLGSGFPAPHPGMIVINADTETGGNAICVCP